MLFLGFLGIVVEIVKGDTAVARFVNSGFYEWVKEGGERVVVYC